jgi:hypothetical protein
MTEMKAQKAEWEKQQKNSISNNKPTIKTKTYKKKKKVH